MIIALWIIAICEVIRIAQNSIQLVHVKKSEKREINAYNEFFKRMKQSDREFVRNMLEEYEKAESEEGNGNDDFDDFYWSKKYEKLLSDYKTRLKAEKLTMIDKIIAEIEELQRAMLYASKGEFNDIYKILDKYKAESEEV